LLVQHAPAYLVVIDDQHSQVSQIRYGNRRRAGMRIEFQWQLEPECRALAHPAAHSDGAAHQFHQLLGNRQSQAGSPYSRVVELSPWLNV